MKMVIDDMIGNCSREDRLDIRKCAFCNKNIKLSTTGTHYHQVALIVILVLLTLLRSISRSRLNSGIGSSSFTVTVVKA